MRFYNRRHRYYCGIDLHVKAMYLCLLDAAGQVLVHRNVKASPAAFLEAIAPYRDDLTVAAECMLTWHWLADVCAAEGITFVLAHALAMKAIHGGKAKNDTLDSHTIAVLLRGGLLPQASVYRAAMRSTRDLLRRRLHLVRKRGQLLAHIQNTRAQCTLPAFERRLAYPANRDGVPEHFTSRIPACARALRSTWRWSTSTTSSSPISNSRSRGRRSATTPTPFTGCVGSPVSARASR